MSANSRLRKTARPRSPARPYHKGNVAADLFAAATRLIGSEGLESVTVRRLCREVGVTPANFYNHYPSVEYLLLDVAAAGAEALTAVFERTTRRHKSREDQLLEIAVQCVQFGIDHPDLFRVMFGHVPGSAMHDRYNRTIEACFARLVKVIYGEDLYRPDDVAWSHSHCQAAYAYFSFTYGLARLVSMGVLEFPTGTRAERQQFIRELAQRFVYGLAVPASSPP